MSVPDPSHWVGTPPVSLTPLLDQLVPLHEKTATHHIDEVPIMKFLDPRHQLTSSLLPLKELGSWFTLVRLCRLPPAPSYNAHDEYPESSLGSSG